jgi:hypothetical protein
MAHLCCSDPYRVPAQAGTHFSVVSGTDEWVPAFAGTYDYSEAADMTRWDMRAMFAAGPARPMLVKAAGACFDPLACRRASQEAE